MAFADAKEAARTLQSLACAKVRVIVKNPKGKDVNPEDEFAFNLAFKDDHFRIKINTIVQSKETVRLYMLRDIASFQVVTYDCCTVQAEEQKATTERIFFDRSSHLQLAIVRVMKSRKTMKHSELVMEVVAQIGKRFKCEQKDIKIAIESLISRECAVPSVSLSSPADWSCAGTWNESKGLGINTTISPKSLLVSSRSLHSARICIVLYAIPKDRGCRCCSVPCGAKSSKW